MTKPEDISLFRFQIIASLLNLEGEPKGTLDQMLQKLSARMWEHPRQGSVQYSQGTLEHWLYAYRSGGLDALLPQPRRDRGRSRAIDDEVANRIEELARGETGLDGPGILKELRADPVFTRRVPSLSTLYRFVRARELPLRANGSLINRDHRAFEFDLAGDCWQMDIMYGPDLPTRKGTRRRTYLFAVLDDATRLIAHAQFYFEQHLITLKDALKQAFLKRGLPRRLYSDQGRIFKSRSLLHLAARLGIQLIHTRPYRPQGRAKLERFFGTVRRSFLSRVDYNRLDSIDALNRLLFAFVEGEYHVQPHRGIDGETPLDRWIRKSGGIRPIPSDLELDQLFLDEVTRRVRKDGTIVLDGKAFEPGPRFIGQKVTVRYDPFDLRRIQVFSDRGARIEAFPVDLAGNRRVMRLPDTESTPTSPTLKSLDHQARRLEKEDADE
jgi:putative transposase